MTLKLPELPDPEESKLAWLFRATGRLALLLFIGGLLMVGGCSQDAYTPRFVQVAQNQEALRTIQQVWLSLAQEAPAGAPPENPADIFATAAMLARYQYPPPVEAWFAPFDPAWLATTSHPTAILAPGQNAIAGKIHPDFQGSPVAWAVAIFPAGTNLDKLPPQTPLMWTRGLQPDGTWREDNPFSGEQGFLAYAGGHRERYRQVRNNLWLVKWGTNEPTTNILEALPPGTRISEYAPPPEVAAFARWLELKGQLLVVLSGALLLATCLVGTHSSIRGWKQRLAQLAGSAVALWFWCEWLG